MGLLLARLMLCCDDMMSVSGSGDPGVLVWDLKEPVFRIWRDMENCLLWDLPVLTSDSSCMQNRCSNSGQVALL